MKQPTDEIISSADEVLNASDVEYDLVEAWGGKKLRIQSLSSEDLVVFREANEGPAKRTAVCRLIIASAVNAAGEKLFTEKQLGQLALKSHKITDRIADAILKLNGIEVGAAKRPNA